MSYGGEPHHNKLKEEGSTCTIHDLFSKGSETTLENCDCSITCNCPFSYSIG